VKQIPGRQDDADRAQDREQRRAPVRANQDQKLAHKAVKTGKARTAQGHHQEEEAEDWHARPQAPELAQQPRVPPLVEHAHHQEQGARAQAVAYHLQHRAADRLLVQCENAQHHKAHVRHRRIGHQRLQIALRQRHQCAVEYPHDRQDRDQRRIVRDRGGKERQRKAHKAVRPQLQEHARQNDRTRGRGLDVRIGQPRMEREQRHLDRERERECQEPDLLQPRRHAHSLQFEQVKRAGLEIERQDRHQHQRRTRQRVEEELDRGVYPVVAAPLADQQRHRNQAELPENVEQDKVEREENSQHCRLHQKHQRQIAADVLLDVLIAERHRDRHQKGRQYDQPQADPVHPQMIMDVQTRHPGVALDELHVGDILPAGQQQQADHKGRDRRAECQRLLYAVAGRNQNDYGAGKRQKSQN